MLPRDYAPSGFFVLRTPLFPFSILEAEGRGLGGSAATAHEMRWDRDRALARRRLRARLDLDVVREAIFLASPSLDERTEIWRNDPDGDSGRGIESGLVKYLSRMAARCTPFGLFAGNSVGTIDCATRLDVPDRDGAVRHTRLDMDFLSEAIERLGRDPELRRQLSFSTNSSLYEVGAALRYAEARMVDGKRAHFLVDVEPHDPLRRALFRARHGASLASIAEAVAGDDVPLDVAREFVTDLVDAQLLTADLGPAVTGPDSLDDLIERLIGIDAARGAVVRLAEVRDALIDLDGEGLGASPERYRALAADLAALAPVDLTRLFQVDLARPAEGLTIAASLVDELLQGVQLLLDLFGRGRRDVLATFRREFEERHGDREVALVEVLDEEIGIGFETAHHPAADPSPLLAGLPFPPAEEEERFAWGARARFLAWKLAETIASGREEMTIEREEVARFHDPEGPRLADAFHIAATLLAPAAPKSAPNGPHCVLESAAGPSGARLLGRFCHGDSDLRAFVEAHLRAEEALDPDIVYFEIVHLPEGRIGNILARPRLRDYELAFLGRGGAPREKTLRLDDLTVRLENGRIVLRSRSLDREVRPRLTSAHDTSWRSLGAYRFLAALQTQGIVEGIAWVWGPLENQPRLPRVRFGRLVLARQQWNGRADDVRRLAAARGHEAYRQVQAWRSERGVPRWVGLVHADNVLPLDLDHPLSVATFVRELRGKEMFTLQEVFPGARADAVRGPDGRYMNEVVIPVVRKTPLRVAPVRERERAAAVLPAVFSPGSEWLTVKLYGGPALLDRILQQVVAPVAHAAAASGAIRRWFFLRFADPQWHVRARFEGDPARLLAEVLAELHRTSEGLRRDGGLHRIVVDPYVREVRRYGGDKGLVLCEEIFHQDSRAVLAFLAGASGDDGLDARWRFAFRGMDLLLEDLGLDVARRRAVVQDLLRQFLAEFRADAPLRKGLRDRARLERRALEDLLAERGEAAGRLAEGLAALRERSRAIAAPCAELRRLAEAGTLVTSLEDIAGSLLHMHANRALRSAPRPQELVLYSFLENAYDARLARAAKESR